MLSVALLKEDLTCPDCNKPSRDKNSIKKQLTYVEPLDTTQRDACSMDKKLKVGKVPSLEHLVYTLIHMNMCKITTIVYNHNGETKFREKIDFSKTACSILDLPLPNIYRYTILRNHEKCPIHKDLVAICYKKQSKTKKRIINPNSEVRNIITAVDYKNAYANSCEKYHSVNEVNNMYKMIDHLTDNNIPNAYLNSSEICINDYSIISDKYKYKIDYRFLPFEQPPPALRKQWTIKNFIRPLC